MRQTDNVQSMSTSHGRRQGISPVRERLKRETADLHRRLETRLGLLEPNLSLDRYRRILELFLGFYAPLEGGMVRLASAGLALGLPLRDRTGLIERDLLWIGLSRQEVVDLTGCDREPIHIPGTIQPFGVLLVLAEPSLTVTQVSENVGDHLPTGVNDVLGQPLATLLDQASVDAVSDALSDERWHDLNPLQIGAHGKRFDGIVHRHEGAAILELEPNPGPPLAMPHPFRAALIRLQRVVTSVELGNVVVEQMRRVTGFERVLFYRFHEDDHGSVDAEAKKPDLEPYLGLHYPASDIPAQARALYRRNWLRLIFDRSARPARVVPTLRADTGGSLDLSFSVLRSVSPIHLEYMANMGVQASMSISLIVH